jgi:chemotaxis response regulator CheB
MLSGRVLIIDDSITIRAMVEQLLANQGLWSEIAVAPDVPTARQLMDSFKPTIITLDLRFYPHAPIVVVSSSTKEGSEEAKEAIEAGATACFDKSRILSESGKFVRLLVKAALAKRRTVERRPGFDHRDYIGV